MGINGINSIPAPELTPEPMNDHSSVSRFFLLGLSQVPRAIATAFSEGSLLERNPIQVGSVC